MKAHETIQATLKGKRMIHGDAVVARRWAHVGLLGGGTGIAPLVHDPLAHPEATQHEFGIALSPIEDFTGLDLLIYAVSHDHYAALGVDAIQRMVAPGGVLIDVKSVLAPHDLREDIRYWSL